MLACAALFFSVTSAWGLGRRDSASSSRPSSSRVVTVMGAKSGVELTTQKPYVRLVRASLAPASLPLAVGAYIALAASPVPPADATIDASVRPDSSCLTCSTANAPCCSHTGATCCDPDCVGTTCRQVTCDGLRSNECYTCGAGTCDSFCNG